MRTTVVPLTGTIQKCVASETLDRWPARRQRTTMCERNASIYIDYHIGTAVVGKRVLKGETRFFVFWSPSFFFFLSESPREKRHMGRRPSGVEALLALPHAHIVQLQGVAPAAELLIVVFVCSVQRTTRKNVTQKKNDKKDKNNKK